MRSCIPSQFAKLNLNAAERPAYSLRAWERLTKTSYLTHCAQWNPAPGNIQIRNGAQNIHEPQTSILGRAEALGGNTVSEPHNSRKAQAPDILDPGASPVPKCPCPIPNPTFL